MTFDRDPRWVGSVSGRDFPAPLRRLLLCLGITPPICLPHRPDKTADVERFHRTYGSDCSLLLITRSPFLTPLSACSRSISSVSMPSPKCPLFWGKKTLFLRVFFPLLFCHQGCYFYLSSPRKGKRGQLSACLRLICRRVKQIVPQRSVSNEVRGISCGFSSRPCPPW